MSVVNDNDSGRDSEYYFDRANIFSLEGKYEEAIVYYNKAIELDPNYTDAYNGREKAKNDLGKYEEAIKDYDKAIELNPNNSSAYNDRGFTKYYLGQYEDSIKDFNKVIELTPNYTNANKVIELTPNYTNAYYDRGNAKKIG